MVGDHHRGASILREGGKEQLQHRREILMGRGHPGQDFPGVPLQHAEAVDPAIRQFDQIPDIHEPHMMPIARAIGEVFERRLGRRFRASAGPRSWGPVELAIACHGASDGRLTRG